MSFDTVNYLLFSKRKKEMNSDLLSEFNPYFTTKTFSFYKNGEMVDYINDTLNRYGNIFREKETQFKFFENIIPIVKRTKINYIKSPKIEKTEKINREFY
jgi:hypothetical protein